MFKVLKTCIKIDLFSTINSFIYSLRRLPIFRKLINYNIYKDTKLKKDFIFIAYILDIIKKLIYRIMYFIIIYIINNFLFHNTINSFIHIFSVFCLIGLFVHTELLATDHKKYNSLVLFQLDPNKYLRSYLVRELFDNAFFNLLTLFILNKLIGLNTITIVLLVLLNISTKAIGEFINMIIYRKYKYPWYHNLKVYYPLVLFLTSLVFLPFINICMTNKLLLIITIVLYVLHFLAIKYLFSIKDYKLIFKDLYYKNSLNTDKNDLSYTKQVLAINEKDVKVDDKKFINLKGYDLFNKIFFERHKHLLLNSAKNYALILTVLLIVVNILTYKYSDIRDYVNTFFTKHTAYFILIMYFINRGSIITQAMFYNCDHAMLKYNFYRESSVILNLFRKRLTTIVKVNLIPVMIMVLGTIGLLIQLKFNIINILLVSLFIILLSVFFSVHYLVIYYLLQPYNSNMQVKKVSYSVVIILTYIIAYNMRRIIASPLLFSLFGLVITIIYIACSLFLVYKYAYKTFKINN